MSNEAAKTTSNNPFDIFIVGLKKGLNIGLYSLLPNVVMAFVLTYILQLWGVMDFLGRTCGGIMGIFDLPGQAITVLLATWMSCGAGVGVAASLASSGVLNGHDVTIMAPALILMASQIQYMGRLLGVADVPKKYWPLLMLNSLLMAFIGMLLIAVFRLSSRNGDKAAGQTAACPRRSFEIRGYARFRRAPLFAGLRTQIETFRERNTEKSRIFVITLYET